MINKTTQEKQTIEYIQLLEYKLQQDLMAHNKVMKWAKTIQKRIECTQAQLDTLKRAETIN